MKRFFWASIMGAVALTLGLYYLTSEASRDPNTPIARWTNGRFLSDEQKARSEAEEAMTAPDEPTPEPVPLPAAPIPVEHKSMLKPDGDPFDRAVMPLCDENVPDFMPPATA